MNVFLLNVIFEYYRYLEYLFFVVMIRLVVV